MIWWLKKTNETNCFKVKAWGGSGLDILKVNQFHYKRIEIFTKDLTINLMLSPVVTYRHGHVQSSNPQTHFLLGFTATQATLLVTLRSHSKVLNHPQ